MSVVWKPNGGVDAFKDRALDARGRGKTWRAIAKDEGCGFSTLYNWFLKNPAVKEDIKSREKGEQADNIRQTLLECAIKDKNVVALIYLAKAKLKMWDTPKAQADADAEANKPKAADLHTGMTREDWKKKLEEKTKREAK